MNVRAIVSVGCAWMLSAGCGGGVAENNVAVCEDYITTTCGASSGSIALEDWPFTGVFADCSTFGSDPFRDCDVTPLFDCLSERVTTCDNPDDWPYTRDTTVYDAAEACAAELGCSGAPKSFFQREDTAYYEDCACSDGQVCLLEGVDVAVYAESCAADGTLGADPSACSAELCPSSGLTDCIDGELWFTCSAL